MPHQDFPGVPVPRSRDTEGVAVGDRLAQQVDQRVLDAPVLDAGGSQKKLHASDLYTVSLVWTSAEEQGLLECFALGQRTVDRVHDRAQ